ACACGACGGAASCVGGRGACGSAELAWRTD
ncbi:hypothetical protein A2U01_0099456, partial [Trifolium medium]|nr:hypothetical protein [Trifolium medium]